MTKLFDLEKTFPKICVLKFGSGGSSLVLREPLERAAERNSARRPASSARLELPSGKDA
jgi:hypothetical protein